MLSNKIRICIKIYFIKKVLDSPRISYLQGGEVHLNVFIL